MIKSQILTIKVFYEDSYADDSAYPGVEKDAPSFSFDDDRPHPVHPDPVKGEQKRAAT